MRDIDVGRVRELVEGRFARVGEGPPPTSVFSFRVGFPHAPLTEREKRAVYSMVIGFAEQLKRQTNGEVLYWRLPPELSVDFGGDCRELFFRCGAAD